MAKIIAYCSKKKRECTGKLRKIEFPLKERGKQLENSDSDSLVKQVCALKFDLNEIYNKKAEYALFPLKTDFYENGANWANYWQDCSNRTGPATSWYYK